MISDDDDFFVGKTQYDLDRCHRNSNKGWWHSRFLNWFNDFRSTQSGDGRFNSIGNDSNQTNDYNNKINDVNNSVNHNKNNQYYVNNYGNDNNFLSSTNMFWKRVHLVPSLVQCFQLYVRFSQSASD